jgi:hypothetical protein
MENKEFTLKQFELYKGQHVLIDGVVRRFIGIAEDEYDYLYITWDGRKFDYHTILDHFIPLKNKIDDEDYDTIVYLSKINHLDSDQLLSPKDDAAKSELMKLNTICKFEVGNEIKNNNNITMLSELCWDFN